MNGEVDSLDHIQAITGDHNAGHNLEEPRYQMYQNNDNPASSFGAGGRISTVIDPEYRSPASNCFQTQAPLSFSDLNPQNNHMDPKSNFLHQYGPVPGVPHSSHQFPQPQQQVRSISLPVHQPQPVILHYQTQTSHSMSIPNTTITSSSDKPPTFQIGPYISPATIADRSNLRTSATASAADSSSYDQSNLSSGRIPLPANPPLNSNPSPPLDSLNTNMAQQISTSKNVIDTNAPQSTLNRIPKKSAVTTSSRADPYESMNMLELQKSYRRAEESQIRAKKERDRLEKILGDLTRSSHGKNVELDPSFRQTKDEQFRCEATLQQLKENMDKISDKLKSKFNHTIQPSSVASVSSVQQSRIRQRQRAKMSTATPTPKVDEEPKDNRNKRVMLDLRDDRIWCQPCDAHFDNLKEFCEHLHKREHTHNADPHKSPWRTAVDPVDKKSTYNTLKSICSKLEAEKGSIFTMKYYDEILNANIKEGRSGTISKLKVARERGLFDPNDPMFEIKGYQNLIPISGFYCKLCSRTLCDYTEVEQHLKGYNHNYNHAESISLDHHHEENFRIKRDKSYQREEREKHDHRREKQVSPSKSRLESSVPKTTTSSLPSSLQPRKSLFTAESAKDKVTKGSDKLSNKTVARSKASLLDDSEDEYEPRTKVKDNSRALPLKPSSSKEVKKQKIPEIVPVTKNMPTATLKRLRHDSQKPPTPPIVVDSDTDVSTKNSPDHESNTVAARNSPELDKVVIPQDTHLDVGDPDSPFPHLDMSVTGHIHLKMLKDPRLKQPCQVRMNRINVDDYKEMLLDRTSLMSRITQLMAKKEEGAEKRNDFKSTTVTQPIFFDKDDEDIPVDVDGDDKTDVQSKGASDMEISSTDGESGLQAEKFDMSFLDDFFQEK